MKTARPLNNTLRVIMAGGSVAAFVGGWILLAHSPNPYEQNAPASVNETAPQNQVAPQRQALTPTVRRTNPPRPQSAPTMQPPTSQQQQPNLQQLPSRTTRRQPRLHTGGS